MKKYIIIIVLCILTYYCGTRAGSRQTQNDIKARYILVNEVADDSFGGDESMEQMNFIIDGININ